MELLVKEIILAIVQGLTEWFPISSKGHLVLFSHLLNYENSISFDVALHFGTLMAVFVYFGKEITDILEDILKGHWKSQNAKMGFFLLISSIPAGILGLLFRKSLESSFDSLLVTSLGFAVTGILLFIASIDFKSKKKTMTYRDSFVIGISQAFALLPGVSRSGTTISSGLLIGLDKEKAVKFSFLMSIPVIFGAGLLTLGSERLPPSLIFPTLVSFIVGLATIHALLKIVVNSKKNLRWFGLYVLVLAAILLIYLFVR